MASPVPSAATGTQDNNQSASSWVVGRCRVCWNRVVDACLVLWITRVSLVSVVAGFILLLAVPQARDTFLEVRGESALSLENVLFWGFFFLSILIFWALPVHYCAKRNINLDPIKTVPQGELDPARSSRFDRVAILVPQILAAACLLAVALGCLLANASLRAPSKAGAELYSQANWQTNVLALAALFLMIGVWKFLDTSADIANKLGTKWRTLDSDFGQVALIILTAVFFLLLVVPISWLAQFTVVRAPLIPLLLGGWVPPLAWLAYKGRVYRAPFILALLVSLELLTIVGNNHDVRTEPINSKGQVVKEGLPGNAARARLHDKIVEWRRANGCSKETEKCEVRPIIVAASGGASRAGFFTASILGRLTDITQGSDEYRDFRQQLFAISSVSGSSVGAAFFVAAVRDSEEPKHSNKNKGEQPCQSEKVSPLVHSNTGPTTWQSCMETLLSGDFLSSTLFAYLYKDSLRGLWAGLAEITLKLGVPIAVPDRAVILEQSWERHYCEYTDTCDGDFMGLERPFLSLARLAPCPMPLYQCPPPPPAPPSWVPLLFINTTDVDTGRRVVISPIAPRARAQRLFPDAYDLHELMADEAGREGRDLAQPGVVFPGLQGDYYFLQKDIRLSTAAGLSARFPIVSPSGNVRNKKRALVARLVDGGYFENFGAATALDLAMRLRQEKLDPVLIQITNEPQLLGARRVKFNEDKPPIDGICKVEPWDPICDADPPVIQVSYSHLFSGVRGPLSGLFGAREAQGARTLLQLANSANTHDQKRNGCAAPNVRQKEESFIRFSVRPQYVYDVNAWDDVVAKLFGELSRTCEMRDVSMSWWLSKPVQAYLHYEVGEAELTRATLFMEKSR